MHLPKEQGSSRATLRCKTNERYALATTTFLSILGALTCSQAIHAQVPDLEGWNLILNDEFDGNSLNTTYWEALNRRDSYNNEKQYYHPDQVTVSGGNLQLTAIDTPRSGKDYQSGLITSRDLYGPGRFEARIDLPTSQGMWPAFWLNANHIDWPQGGEIDIMENRGSQPNVVSSAYHWQTDPGPCCDQHQYVFEEYTGYSGRAPVDYHAGFHTYAAEWDETSIRFYVDDVLYHTVTESADRPVFETPKNIILNLAVGGVFGGDPDGTTAWPQTMLVDYVRVWEADETVVTPEPELNLLSNPGFDDSVGLLEGWNTFGNNIPNVLASTALANDGSQALKIFGQFNGGENHSGASQGVAISGGESLRAIASTHTPAWDTLLGKDNDVTMRLEFFSEFGASSNSASYLGEVSQVVHNGTTAEDLWHEHTLEAIAPDGAVEARLSFSFGQYNTDDGAIWIDSTGLFIDATLAGDYNEDGTVDSADYVVWRDSQGADAGTLPNDPVGGTIGQAHYETWRDNFGRTSSFAASQAVPEPSALLILACGTLVAVSRSCRSISA